MSYARIAEGRYRLTETLGDVLHFLLQRKVIEPFANRELTIDAFLRDIEVLDVEEAILANCLDQGLRELFPAFRSSIEREIDGDEIRPIKVLLQLKSESRCGTWKWRSRPWFQRRSCKSQVRERAPAS